MNEVPATKMKDFSIYDLDGKTVLVGLDLYRIKIIEGLIDEEPDGAYSFGCVRTKDRTVELASTMDRSRAIQVLMHELTHCILDSTGYSAAENIDIETVCYVAGPMMLQVYRDNSWLLGEVSKFLRVSRTDVATADSEGIV